jgi:hypothetical protein
MVHFNPDKHVRYHGLRVASYITVAIIAERLGFVEVESYPKIALMIVASGFTLEGIQRYVA